MPLNRDQDRDLLDSRRTLTWTLLSSFACIALICSLASSNLGSDINDRVGTTFDFRIRDWLGQSPKLDSRIKIFGFDDKTLSNLGRPELYIDEWAKGLDRLSRDNPKVIIIDKMFSIMHDPNKRVEEALKSLKQLKTNFVVGSFATPQEIAYRSEMPFRKNLYDLRFIEKNGLHIKPFLKSFLLQNSDYRQSTKQLKRQLAYPILKDYRKSKLYGPSSEFQKSGAMVGHVQYSGHNKAAPLIQVADHYAVPHVSLFAAESIKLRSSKILVNDIEVPIDSDGDLVVNLSPPHTYYKGQKRLDLILENDRKKPLVKPGDVVLLLPNIYTGGTDFHLTPFGYAPGGFILAALINSTLGNQWLKSIKFPWLFIATASVLGGILGASASSIVFWLLLTSGFLAIVAISTILFSYFSLIVPWLWLGLAFLTNGLLIFAEKARYAEKRAQRLQLVEAERKLLEKELKEAAVMAEAYCPDPLPNWPNLLITCFHKPIHAASGDWYAFEQANDKQLCHMIMCDITGHGVQAALVVSACKTLLGNIRSLSPERFESRRFIADYMLLLNQILWDQGHGQHVSTLLGLSFDMLDSKVHYLAAGHPYPLLRQNKMMGERPKSLLSRHNPLGLYPEIKPEIKSMSWQSGDEIITFTDGIPLLENRRILKKVEKLDPQSSDDRAESLFSDVWALETSKSGKVIDDDVSIVWFKNLAK